MKEKRVHAKTGEETVNEVPDILPDIASAVADKKVEIKNRAAALLAPTDYVCIRDTEEQALGGQPSLSAAAVRAVYQGRKAIRDASNAAEAAVDALVEVREVMAFDVTAAFSGV